MVDRKMGFRLKEQRKEIIRTRAKVNQIEYRKAIENINQTENLVFEKM